MRRQEQDRNQSRSRYAGRDYDSGNVDRNSDWNRTEDHFGTGHRFEEENRNDRHVQGNGTSGWRSGMQSSDYSRGNGNGNGYGSRNNRGMNDLDNYGSDYGQQSFTDRDSGMGNRFSNSGRMGGQSTYGNGYEAGSTGSSFGSSYGSSQDRTGHFGKGPKGYKRSDERIKEEVCEALYRASSVDASEIDVEVKEGTVTLKGSVDSREAKRAAESCVENLSGVDDVRNEIRVSRNDSTMGTGSTSTMNGGTSQFKNQKLA